MTRPANRRLATEQHVADGLATKVNSSTYTAGLAAKQDAATLAADTAAHVTDGSALDVALKAASVAAVEDAATVTPAGAWDFAEVPTVDGAAIEVALTPESQGAVVDGTANDAAAFAALMGLDVGGVDLAAVTPPGASTPAYLLSTTVDVPWHKSLRGDGYMSRVRVPADGGSFTGGIIFRLNTNTAHTWVQPFPGLPSTSVENFVIHATEAAANGHLLTAFEFGGQHRFSELYFIAVDQGIEQIIDYCDLVRVQRIYSWNKPNTANWLIDLPYSGDGVDINGLHLAIDPALDYRPKGIHLKFKNGATVRNLINGDHLIEYTRGLVMESMHLENGQVTLLGSSGRVASSLLYMRNRAGQKVTPLVISQPSGQSSSVSSVVTMEDLGFAYVTTLPGSYPTDNTPNFQINVVGGAAPRSLVNVRNLYRLASSTSNPYGSAPAYGVTCGDAAFDAYSHLASVESTFRNGEWNINGALAALPSSVGIDVAGSATDNSRTWQAPTGTYYYKLAALYDSKRMIGRVGSAEKSQAVTNGQNAPALVIDVNFRRTVMLRLYRGTATGSYDKYVDVPLISAGRLHDSGVDVGGFPWISRTAGAVDTINTDIDAGLRLSPGETGATSDAYGHAVAYARTSTAPPTAGSWRRGDRVELVAPVVSGASRLMGWVRLTDCTSAAPAHVMGTDWAELRSPTS